MIEWTPNKASHIKTHKNIKILLETVSGYDLVKYFDITVTGICTSGNVLAIWTGDQRISTDSSKFLANIIAYTDSAIDNCGRNNNQDCTAENNYEFDQTNPSSIKSMFDRIGVKKFDVILEDGLHEYNANICFFENSVNFLSDSGVYIIEDVYFKDEEKFIQYFKDKPYNFSLINIYHEKNIANNNLIVIRK